MANIQSHTFLSINTPIYSSTSSKLSVTADGVLIIENTENGNLLFKGLSLEIQHIPIVTKL